LIARINIFTAKAQRGKVRKETHKIIHRGDAEDAEKTIENECIYKSSIVKTLNNSIGFYYGFFTLRSLRLCGEYYFLRPLRLRGEYFIFWKEP
jgi:hypothetical protein